MKFIENMFYTLATVVFFMGIYHFVVTIDIHTATTADYLLLTILFAVMGNIAKSAGDSKARDAMKLTKK